MSTPRTFALLRTLACALVLCAALSCGTRGSAYTGRWECSSGGGDFFEIKPNDGAFLVTDESAATYPASLDDKEIMIVSGVPLMGSLPLPIDSETQELICSACTCKRYAKKSQASQDESPTTPTQKAPDSAPAPSQQDPVISEMPPNSPPAVGTAPKAVPTSTSAAIAGAKPRLRRVAVRFETVAGRRRPEASMRVDVGYSEFGFASNYEQPPLAPGVSFTVDAPVLLEIPLDYGIEHGMTECPKEFVVRALGDPDPVHLYVETNNPEEWSFNADVTFEYSDGVIFRGHARDCRVLPNPGYGQCAVRQAM